MARFGARIANYSHGVREAEVENYANGKQKVIVPHIEAQFENRFVTDDDRNQILSSPLRFTGLPFDTETETTVDPRSRMGVFDSKEAAKLLGWSTEDEELVVKTLRESSLFGIDFVELEAEGGIAPWQGYDKVDDVKKLVALIEATQSDPEAVLAYERANQKRGDVIEALAGLLDPEQEKEVVVQA